MAQPPENVPRPKVNVLLPFPLEARVGGDVMAALASDDRTVRREAIAEIADRHVSFVDTNASLVREVVARLSAAGAGPVARTTRIASADWIPAAEHHLSIDDLDPTVGPPEDATVYNHYTGVLTVSAPADVQPAARHALSRQGGICGWSRCERALGVGYRPFRPGRFGVHSSNSFV